MQDLKAEEIRQELRYEVNAHPPSREDLAKAGKASRDTVELQRDFEVHGFLAPFVVVTRKSDKQKGSLMFSHYPRVYWDFVPDV